MLLTSQSHGLQASPSLPGAFQIAAVGPSLCLQPQSAACGQALICVRMWAPVVLSQAHVQQTTWGRVVGHKRQTMFVFSLFSCQGQHVVPCSLVQSNNSPATTLAANFSFLGECTGRPLSYQLHLTGRQVYFCTASVKQACVCAYVAPFMPHAAPPCANNNKLLRTHHWVSCATACRVQLSL